MEQGRKNGELKSNMDRLKEVTQLLDFDPEKDSDILLRINDELKEIKGYLDNGDANKIKVNICRNKIDQLINDLRKRSEDVTKRKRK